MSASSNAKRIAELNDQLRARAGLPVANGAGIPQGLIVLTRGIVELAPERQCEIFAMVRSFDRFTEDNDPFGEHDFGSFVVLGVGKVFWKIDYYADRSCAFGSEDPADPDRSFRVLTIMLASEY